MQKKSFLIPFMVFVLFMTSSCSLFRTKDPAPPVDKTERNLVFYGMYDDEEMMEPLVQQYLAENSYTRITYKSFDDFEEYEKRILDELAEGAGPDVFMMPNSWFVKNRKKLVPMPETMGTVTDFKATFVDVAAQDFVTTDDNGVERVYGMSMYVDNLALYYNHDHFEDRVPTRGKPASTWDGIKNDVFALTKPDGSFSGFEVAGIAMGRSENILNAVDILYALMIQNGTQFYNDVMSEAVFATSASAGQYPAVDALEFFVEFADSKQKHYGWNEQVGAAHELGDISSFAAGEVSMIFGYSQDYELILKERDKMKLDGDQVVDVSAIKVAPFPQLIDPAVSTEKRDTYASYFGLGVAHTSEYPDAAWDFLTFLTAPDGERYYFENTHKPTSRRDLIPEQRLDPVYGTFVDQVGYAESFPVVDYFEFRNLFSGVIDAVNEGQSARSALTGIQDAITLDLPTNGYIVPLNAEYYEQLEEEEKEEE